MLLSLGNLFATYRVESPTENFSSKSLTVVLFYIIMSGTQPEDLNGYVLEMPGGETRGFEAFWGRVLCCQQWHKFPLATWNGKAKIGGCGKKIKN